MYDFLKKLNACKDYVALRFLGYNLRVLQEYHDKTFLEICCHGSSNAKVPFLPNHCSELAKVFRFEYQGETFYYKSFLLKNWQERLKNVFRCSRAERAFKGHLLLQENGFNAPCINVVGVKNNSNFIVSQAVNGISAYTIFTQMCAPAMSKEKKVIISQFALIIGRLHKLGILHGDLRLGNVLVELSDTSQTRYFFLDNERTVRYRKLPKHKRLKNLVQINISLDSIATKTDRLRFFNSYLTENPELIPLKKQWLAHIIHKTEQRIARRTRHHATAVQNSIFIDKAGTYV